eukprot:6194970-Pleurochrysis_carterae.AAC.1
MARLSVAACSCDGCSAALLFEALAFRISGLDWGRERERFARKRARAPFSCPRHELESRLRQSRRRKAHPIASSRGAGRGDFTDAPHAKWLAFQSGA